MGGRGGIALPHSHHIIIVTMQETSKQPYKQTNKQTIPNNTKPNEQKEKKKKEVKGVCLPQRSKKRKKMIVGGGRYLRDLIGPYALRPSLVLLWHGHTTPAALFFLVHGCCLIITPH